MENFEIFGFVRIDTHNSKSVHSPQSEAEATHTASRAVERLGSEGGGSECETVSVSDFSDCVPEALEQLEPRS